MRFTVNLYPTAERDTVPYQRAVFAEGSYYAAIDLATFLLGKPVVRYYWTFAHDHNEREIYRLYEVVDENDRITDIPRDLWCSLTEIYATRENVSPFIRPKSEG